MQPYLTTWITHHEPKFQGYHAYWENRPTLGGGIGILIKTGLAHSVVPLLPFPDGVLDVQAINIHLRDGEIVTIMNVYNPNENLSYNEILHYLNQIR